MRDRFPGYYRPSQAQFDEMWKTGLIVPDANILLHLLRYGRDTRRQVLDTLSAFQPRLWVPHRVAFEFLRRWRDVDSESRAAFEKLKEAIRREGTTLSGLFDAVTRQQVIDAGAERVKITSFVDALCASVDEAAAKHPSVEESEAIVDEVSDLIGDSVGETPSRELREKWILDGNARYAAKIPPGYKDEADKQGDDRFGDYMIWEELIAVSKLRALPVIFVSDDRKEDWAVVSNGRDLGPRPDLMQEFAERTDQSFYSYPFIQFLSWSEKYGEVKVSEAAIAEIKEEEERQAQRDEAHREAEFASGAPTPSASTAITSVGGSTTEWNQIFDTSGIAKLTKELADTQAAWNRIADPSGIAKLSKEIADGQAAWKRIVDPSGIAKLSKEIADSQAAWTKMVGSNGLAKAMKDLADSHAAWQKALKLGGFLNDGSNGTSDS